MPWQIDRRVQRPGERPGLAGDREQGVRFTVLHSEVAQVQGEVISRRMQSAARGLANRPRLQRRRGQLYRSGR